MIGKGFKMTPEGKVKQRVKDILKKHNVYFAMPVGNAYGKHGVPDFICCHYGLFVAIETKAGDNEPTKLQEANLASIELSGGIAIVVNETNVDKLPSLLSKIEWHYRRISNSGLGYVHSFE